MSDALRPTLLRRLTLAGGAPLAAASGLVCEGGRAWVIGDDLLHLACFADATSAGRTEALLPGVLPADAKARKAAKPDFECLFTWRGGLVALGSGSRPNRRTGVARDRRGARRAFDLEPLHAALRARLGAINIEGAFVQAGRFVVANRGAEGGAPNAIASWPEAVLAAVVAGRTARVPAPALLTPDLGRLGGVMLAFTDATPLADGAWLFAAAAEDKRGSYADGAVLGSVIGHVDADGRVKMRRVHGRRKVEGIAARVSADGALDLALVTDDDDPSLPASMLAARWA
jgi:hypothetical protein